MGFSQCSNCRKGHCAARTLQSYRAQQYNSTGSVSCQKSLTSVSNFQVGFLLLTAVSQGGGPLVGGAGEGGRRPKWGNGRHQGVLSHLGRCMETTNTGCRNSI